MHCQECDTSCSTCLTTHPSVSDTRVGVSNTCVGVSDTRMIMSITRVGGHAEARARHVFLHLPRHARSLFFFLITLEPRYELYKSL